jgi:hypothetical protein
MGFHGRSGMSQNRSVADGVGFEPTNPCGLAVFKTAALNRSATHPAQSDQRLTTRAERTKRGGWHPIGTMPTSSRQLKCQSVRRFSLLRQRLESA